MPGMDGIEATRQVRNLKSKVRDHDIPIIAMTAHALEGDRDWCLQAGMDDYISKPIASQTLIRILSRWLLKTGDEPYMQPKELTRTPDSATPVVFDRVGMMERVMGDVGLVRLVTQTFLSDIPTQIAALRRSLALADATEVARQAHTLKGAAANVGGEALRALAMAMEKAAQVDDLDWVAARMNDLEAQFFQLKEAMTEELGQAIDEGQPS
jgi:CheY-like chemotaxis protein